jgi:hypothetical protein
MPALASNKSHEEDVLIEVTADMRVISCKASYNQGLIQGALAGHHPRALDQKGIAHDIAAF